MKRLAPQSKPLRSREQILNFLLIFITSNLVGFSASAQDLNDDYEYENQRAVHYLDSSVYEWGGHFGYLLPQSIVGVRENYPLVGTWFSHPTAYGSFEYNLSTINSAGVSLYDLSLSLRIDFRVFDIFEGYLRLGAQGVHYRPEGSSDFATSYGSHLGFGNYIQFAGPYWGRVDFKFGFGPGNTMIITTGVVYRWGQSEKSN